MSDRRCLFVSTFNADRRPWNGVAYECLRVLAQIETGRILAPEGRRSVVNSVPDNQTLLSEVGFRTARRLRRKLTGAYTPLMRPTELTADHDILFFVCQFLEEVPEIEQIRGWRERSRRAVIFLLEGWTSTFPDYPREMELLSRFDHVFVLNGSSVAALRRLVRAPVSQLNTASDAVLAAPPLPAAARSIDMICLGRMRIAHHAAMLRIAEEQGLFYFYDVWKGLRADDWAAVRLRNAELIRRSRHFLVWEPDAWHQPWRDGTGRDVALSTRYFEGAAGGAVLLGSAPKGCPEFDEAFDWPDAVVELGDDPAGVLAALNADPMRVLRIRTQNVLASLRRHDWAHRWAEVLDVLGEPLTVAHRARLARLDLLAAQIDVQPSRRAGLQSVQGGIA